MTEPATKPAVTLPSHAPKGGVLGALFWPLRLLKRLYAWVVGWADTRFGTPALVVLSFVESSFFPIPPDPLLIALCLGRRKRALWYGLLCTVASVLGGIAGWYIGQALFGWVVDVIGALGAGPSWFGTAAAAEGLSADELAALPRAGELVFYPDGYFYLVQRRFEDNALLAYFSAALSPIPYKVFTIAGGVFSVSLPMLIAGSIAGRGMRFMGLSVLIYIFGDKVKPLIEKYFEWITIGVVVLLVLFFVLLRLLA
ncbi:MAG: DedA family protein [Planctomycetota bacterium]|nr:DedA family protein [Planctomycetota bacterium]